MVLKYTLPTASKLKGADLIVLMEEGGKEIKIRTAWMNE
jgi:hypothetical protein